MPPGPANSGKAPIALDLVFLVLALFLTLLAVVADPPQPYGIAGWIFDRDGTTQMPLGTSYSINNTNSSFYLENETSVPFPGQSGRYSETVEAYVNETMLVRAWNDTHYGYTSVNISDDLDNVNISLNLTRMGEPNVSMVNPPNNTLYEPGDNFTIRTNVRIDLGATDALDCNATVSFSNPGVVTLRDGENTSQYLGNLSLGTELLLNWSANASSEGLTDITVTVVCDPNSTGFFTTDSDTSHDINVHEYIPPTPHGLAGWIFRQDGTTQVPLGTSYWIEDFDSGFSLRNETRIPFPGYTGRYSETIQGNDGDLVNVTAWNLTHIGITSVNLSGDMEGVNVTLDRLRASETNVTITWPPDITPVSKMKVTNVTARVQVIGGSDGENCSATLTIQNQTVLNITSAESWTQQLGNITLFNYTYVSWDVNANFGESNITVNASCLSDDRVLDRLDNDTILANITSPGIWVDSLVCDDPIDLEEGTLKVVRCNATITNENFAVNITSVNATLYDISESALGSADDNNDHYTNLTCENVSMGLYEANYTCVFPLQYYANNGTWRINLTVLDNFTLITNNSVNTTTVNSLFAFSSSSAVIDFGNLAPTNTSETDVNLTLTNTGNQDINISLYGYANLLGDNLSMNCSIGNISVSKVHYDVRFGQAYSSMTELSNTSTQISDFTLYQRTDDTGYDNDRNTTHWKIQVPLITKGFCNGTVVLGAEWTP